MKMLGRRLMPPQSLHKLSNLRLVSKRRSCSSGGSSASPSILRNPLQWYVTKLDTHPITTKCLSSGLISGSGDLLCQSIVAKKKETAHEFDWMRTLRFTILGSFLVAPTVHLWYGMLMSRIPGTGVAAVAKRLFCDQGLFAPLFTPTFISMLTVLEHVSSPLDQNNEENCVNKIGSNNHHNSDLYTHLTDRLKNDVPEAILVGWSIWTPSMAVMFAFVPGKFQVLYSNCIGFVWNAYLSWRTHEGEEESAQ
mmetsp:Transcript_17882/g.28070  ORF Transcript_17882/g.28070 Transcript_17882/m.28070 type:complete len:251 (-) Transcript_17882:1082-1834(-)